MTDLSVGFNMSKTQATCRCSVLSCQTPPRLPDDRKSKPVKKTMAELKDISQMVGKHGYHLLAL